MILSSFYKKVLSDLLISRNDSFFNYCFEQIFSRKLQASINGNPVTYDQLRLHFLSLRRAYYDAHHHHSHSHHSHSSHSSSSSISTLPHAASAFAPDGSVLKFGPFLANSTNGGREGYLAAHTILANLINNSKWDASPLLSAAQLSSPDYEMKKNSTSTPSTIADSSLDKTASSAHSSADASGSSSSSDEPEQDKQVENNNSPRKRRFRNHHSASSSYSSSSSSSTNSSSSRIRYNALVVTDTMEIQWMEGKEGECRKITKFERTIKRPGYASLSNSGNSSSSNNSSSFSSSSNSSAVKNVKQRRS